MTRVGVIPVTTPGRTIVDLATLVAADRLEDLLDHALRRGLVDAATLSRSLAKLSFNGRRGLPGLRDLLTVRCSRPLTGSSLENLFLRLIKRAGLPLPNVQHEIRAPDGKFVARVDFAYPHVLLAIEIDGYAYHSGRKNWERDRARQNRLAELGWLPLRITKVQISERPDEVVRLVTAALSGRSTAVATGKRP